MYIRIRVHPTGSANFVYRLPLCEINDRVHAHSCLMCTILFTCDPFAQLVITFVSLPWTSLFNLRPFISLWSLCTVYKLIRLDSLYSWSAVNLSHLPYFEKGRKWRTILVLLLLLTNFVTEHTRVDNQPDWKVIESKHSKRSFSFASGRIYNEDLRVYCSFNLNCDFLF